jgi:hypothetical protein
VRHHLDQVKSHWYRGINCLIFHEGSFLPLSIQCRPRPVSLVHHPLEPPPERSISKVSTGHTSASPHKRPSPRTPSILCIRKHIVFISSILVTFGRVSIKLLLATHPCSLVGCASRHKRPNPRIPSILFIRKHIVWISSILGTFRRVTHH